jgi:putative membrane protein
MRNVFKFFFSDLKAIFTHFFALVILLAVLVIPALYAWVNIYANWDPYGNTGNLSIAIASMDRGYVLENGDYVNKGEEIVQEISASTSIKWVPVSAQEAVAGVERGEYYGALVMQENLSRNMYDLTAALQDEEPSIIFYQNAKTNAIANKISTTAATTAEYNIQVKYLGVLIENLLQETEELLGELDGEEALERLIRVLTELRDHLNGYVDMIQRLRDSESGALAGLGNFGGVVGGVNVSGAVERSTAVKNSVSAIEKQLLSRIDEMDARLASLQERIGAMSADELRRTAGEELAAELQVIETELEALQKELPDDGLIGTAVSGALNTLLQRAQSLEQALRSWNGGDSESFRSSVLGALADMRYLTGENLRPAVSRLFDGMVRDMQILINILNGVNTTAADIQPVLSAAQSTIVAVNGSLGELQKVLESAAEGMDRLLDKAIQARDNDLMAELIEILHGDPKQFAEFFAQPVSVTTETIYPVANYGTAMTPFYSTLAIWVGCVVSGAIIKSEPETKGLRRPRPGQLYWGRFLIFFLIGQIQAAIIVAGDIWLLGCQCLYPGLFFLCAAVTSLVFNLLIYALTVTFGDVGKAMGVVVMIVQIAGSSGSYPIEILPEIFSKIYTFFPFPYAINAMRETLCGLYRYDLAVYLGELLLFGLLGILIGRRLKGHFAGVNRFIEEEMEETGVL